MPQFARPAPAGSLVHSPARAAHPPEPSERERLLELQHRVGNQAVVQLLGTVTVQRHPGPTENEEVDGGTAGGPTGAEASAAVTEASEATPTTEAATTSEPAGGTGTTGTTGAGLTGAARKQAIEDTMRASNTGTWALDIVERWKVPVDYEYTGQGSFHRSGSIFINKGLPVGAAALVMMHEAQHADTFKSGKAADRETLSREDYIKQKIADEAEAVVRQIEGMAVTKSLGVDITGGGVTDALKERYLKAFYKKRDELEAANPSMSRAEINAICRKTTRDGEVTSWFHDGTFVTSTNNNSYAVFYGLQWDEVHSKPGKK